MTINEIVAPGEAPDGLVEAQAPQGLEGSGGLDDPDAVQGEAPGGPGPQPPQPDTSVDEPEDGAATDGGARPPPTPDVQDDVDDDPDPTCSCGAEAITAAALLEEIPDGDLRETAEERVDGDELVCRNCSDVVNTGDGPVLRIEEVAP